jgi:hypothetical protein
MCGCGGARVEALTTNQAQALIDAANAEVQRARLTEMEAMVASASQAIGNANSGATAQR